MSLFSRKKKVAAMGVKPKRTNGQGGYPGSKQPMHGGSDASSSASRFYDNGGDTSSSMSDNFYSSDINAPAYGANGISSKMPSGGNAPPPINQRSSSEFLH